MTAKSLTFALLLASAATVQAAEFIPCGPPGAYVTVGQTAQQVLTSCGKPTRSRVYEAPTTYTGKKIRWYYTAEMLRTQEKPPNAPMTQAARYIVEFVDGKVNMIYANDDVFIAYDYCGPVPLARGEVKRGDTMKVVQNRCGTPAFTEEVDSGTPSEPAELTEYTYQFSSTTPSTVVTIKDGVVTDVK